MLCSSSSKNGDKKVFLALAVLICLFNTTSVFAQTYATVNDVYGIFGDQTWRTGAYNITFEVRSCAQADCSDGAWSSLYTNATYNDISSLSNNQYFQYLAYFHTEDLNYTPMLFNITVDYSGNNYPWWDAISNTTYSVTEDSGEQPLGTGGST